jgi:hypothetical protein
MVSNVTISPQAEATLKARAEAAGVDIGTYAARYLELMAEGAPSLEKLSGPVARAVRESGMGEEELADFLEKEKHEMRREKRASERK